MPVMLRTWWIFLRAELAPQEGRLGMAWRTAAVCAIVAMVFMVYRIPLAPIACYLVLFVMKPNTAESLLMGGGILVLVGLIMLPLLVVLAVVTVDHIVMRMLVLCLGTFVFMYLGVASKVGEVGSILALVIGFIMTLIGIAPVGELLTRAILYAGLMATVPMAIMLIVLLLLGPSPAKLAQRHLLRRWQAITAVVRGDQPATYLLPYLREGNASIDKMLRFVSLFALLPKARLVQLQQLTQSSYQLMAAWVALPPETPIEAANRADWARRCEVVVQALAAEHALPAGWQAEPSEQSNVLHSGGHVIEARMHALPGLPAGSVTTSPLPASGFFHDDVATNRSYAQFGVKVTFCAVVCYLTYTALQWQDIHTAMITCYVAALGTVGETVHKLALRICGCLLGAVLGIASIIFLMPHMADIGQLMVVVFAGCLLASWVVQGSERISYAGLQIGLAFVLTVLQGFGPDVSISVALDRIYGIVLGNVVVFVVFTQVWPVRAATQVLQVLRKQVEVLAALMQRPQAPMHIQAALPFVVPQLQALRHQASLSRLEDKVLQDAGGQSLELQRSIDALENAYLQAAYGQRPWQLPQVHAQVHALQRNHLAGRAA